MKHLSRILALIPISILLMTLNAQSATVRWTISNVSFQDGGIASGSFLIDNSDGSLLSWDIQATAGQLASSHHYEVTNSLGAVNFVSIPSISILGVDDPDRYLNLLFTNPLTSPLAINPINLSHPTSPPYGVNGSWESSNLIHRSVVSGFAVGTLVPEPTSAVTLIVGLPALGLAVFYRSRVKRIRQGVA